MKGRSRISARVAADSAIAFATELLGSNQLSHLRVEEISLSIDNRIWNVTLGWDETAITRLESILSPFPGSARIEKLPRVYKVFSVDAATGKVLSMKIRGADK